MAKSKLVQANEKIAEGVTGGFQKIEDGVVGAYRKIEDAFVDRYLTHEGETVENAKKRIADEQAAREAKAKETAEKRAAAQQARTGISVDIGKASVEASKKAGTHE